MNAYLGERTLELRVVGTTPDWFDLVRRPIVVDPQKGTDISKWFFGDGAVPYALFNLEPRGRLFILPGEPVYEGMVIGEHNRGQDINVNPCKEKKLTNIRAAGKDDNVILSPVKPITLEQAISFIRKDELVEVTPKSVRMRKAVLSAQRRHIRPKDRDL